MVPHAKDRGDKVARIQEERSGVRRAEERRGRAAAGRLWPFRRHRDGSHSGSSVRRITVAHQLLPTVVQVEEQAAGGREGDQALSSSGDALCARIGAFKSEQGGQKTFARAISHARSGGI